MIIQEASCQVASLAWGTEGEPIESFVYDKEKEVTTSSLGLFLPEMMTEFLEKSTLLVLYSLNFRKLLVRVSHPLGHSDNFSVSLGITCSFNTFQDTG